MYLQTATIIVKIPYYAFGERQVPLYDPQSGTL